MAFEHGKSSEEEKKDFSINKLDPSFYAKIMSKNSSVCASSTNRISFYGSPGNVSPDWELQPGKPRDRPNIVETAVTPTIIRPGPDVAKDRSTPTTEHANALPKTKFAKKLNKKRVKLGKKLEGGLPVRTNDNDGQSSGSDEDNDFGFSNSDAHGSRPSTTTRSSNARSSSLSSSSSFRSPTCTVSCPNVRLRGLAEGFIKWALSAKISKSTK